ncbi:hypothetical protein RFI_06470 [Reticulomyxa filosa]|uniref:Uncharacterized protein n=1 Tax=Reticulomyxa filosa TaxID=46433 RepID=X6NXB4_RETFI|nr:hypothetical protein RFI_06470 [Reticulomyxa filosa]|eukprot:ETO30651.1 hypothetical protein RFI_06470 [Reticulomyxa filosa]
MLKEKFRSTKNPFIFWYGSVAAISATFVGHYPWFATYNLLNEKLPKYNQHREPLKAYGRQAVMGFCASTVSDTLSNSLRVIKTTRQTYSVPITYLGTFIFIFIFIFIFCFCTAKLVIQKDGWGGLFGRGLKTRIMANGMQGLLFSVLWKYFEDVLYSDICHDCFCSLLQAYDNRACYIINFFLFHLKKLIIVSPKISNDLLFFLLQFFLNITEQSAYKPKKEMKRRFV